MYVEVYIKYILLWSLLALVVLKKTFAEKKYRQ